LFFVVTQQTINCRILLLVAVILCDWSKSDDGVRKPCS